jgi:hypothetical protein
VRMSDGTARRLCAPASAPPSAGYDGTLDGHAYQLGESRLLEPARQLEMSATALHRAGSGLRAITTARQVASSAGSPVTLMPSFNEHVGDDLVAVEPLLA